MSSFRTDALPGHDGPFVIEGNNHQLWVVDHEFVYRLGGGEGRRHSDEVRIEVGSWRYVSVPLPHDVQFGQANYSLSPETRRPLYLSPDYRPPLTENEDVLLDELVEGFDALPD